MIASMSDATRPIPHTALDEAIGPEGFPIAPPHPLRAEHVRLNNLIAAAMASEHWYFVKAATTTVGGEILASGPGDQIRYALAAAERIAWIGRRVSLGHLVNLMRVRPILKSLLDDLLRARLPFDERAINQLAESAVYFGRNWFFSCVTSVVRAIEDIATKQSLSPANRSALEHLSYSDAMNAGTQEARRLKDRLLAVMNAGIDSASLPPPIESGEPWADLAVSDLAAMDESTSRAWSAIVDHALTARGAKPAARWLKTGKSLCEPVGNAAIVSRLSSWFSKVGKPGPGRPMRGWIEPVLEATLISEKNADILKGLAWILAATGDASAASALGDLAEICFQKIPYHGARCPRVANACVVALALLPGTAPVGELARIRSKAKKPSAQNVIGKAISSAASKMGVSVDEVGEMSVPAYGLDKEGQLRRPCGSAVAELTVTGTRKAELHWMNASGKPAKSVPAEVKRDHAEALKELQKARKAIEKMLAAQVQRIERLLITDRTWPVAVWRERYLDHPLLLQLTRRLIWEFTDRPGTQGIWTDGGLVDVENHSIAVREDERVRLWHPSRSLAPVVLRWRQWLEEREVTQPFKQAHREVYLLTDAERTTAVYSNRFAGHILRQHQFASLCEARGWRYRLMGGFDSHNTPTLDLPSIGLRAEFWVDSAGNDEMSSAGIYLHVVTDQVRFYQSSATDPMSVEQVPPIVFSEVMRDVDLFIGVSSVGSDPNWRDHGADQYGTYWQNYSFGELGQSAETRRDVLSRLLPRLKIASRASLDGRFLIIRGDLRTYKIHLGSGNILMEPNDQYLCIVPGRSSERGEVFLPFEGDNLLSVILSKAFLLAADQTISDPTILSQINRA
jgi:hypothetical protein